VAHRAAGAERALLDAIAKAHADRSTVTEAVLDLRGEVLECHECVGDAVGLEQIEDVSKARLVDDGHHRLGPVDRKRTEPAALPAGHHDGLWVKIPTAGHTVQGDNPKDLVAALRAFLS